MCSCAGNRKQSQNDDAGRLPGLGDTVVRRFDAPEALDTRFHEVRTKSALNRVPAVSRLPFAWTVNPYRGCSHACNYCLAPDTPVLLADGRTRAIADLRPGDRIYGTRVEGSYRRFVDDRGARALVDASSRPTASRWRTGRELVASGDHRFLSRRGWKHVTSTEQRPRSRPHLTLNDRLSAPGEFAPAPVEDAEYRRGYLCGMVRGDAHLGTYEYALRPTSSGSVSRSIGLRGARARAALPGRDSGSRPTEFSVPGGRAGLPRGACDPVAEPTGGRRDP